jgi:exodeoxyribonuclease VII large subunit
VKGEVGEREIWTVSEVNRLAREWIEGRFTGIGVSGEISGLRQPASGHCYFTLKDERSELSAVIWRGAAARLLFVPKDGLEVVCFGDLTLYEVKGRYQMVVREIQPRGIGALQLAFRQLKEKLEKEGLFDPDRKRPLPFLPRRIGLVTSPTGAAIQDILHTLVDRFPPVRVLIAPARVQGEGAASEIARAIDLLNQKGNCDVLIVGRGGGSLEDLWAFNTEEVARAIACSRVPVVSAVGHEIDVTISDMVADVRALTPTASAELVVPRWDDLCRELGEGRERLRRVLDARTRGARLSVQAIARHPWFRDPRGQLMRAYQQLDEGGGRLPRALAHRSARHRQRLDGLAGKLDALSPLRVFERGYSLTRDGRGRVLKDVAGVRSGEPIVTRLHRGTIHSTVYSVEGSA